MQHNQITPEWIEEQRQISEIVDMVCEDAPSSVVPLLKQIEKSQTAALDALEAAYAENAALREQNALLTARRDAAVRDLAVYTSCHTCRHSSRADNNCNGMFNGCWEWRGLCAKNAP